MINYGTKFRISVATLTLITCISLLSAQERIGKEIHKTFDISKQTNLGIENKYGNIDIRNWEKPSIDVRVQIKLFDLSDKKAQEVLDMIHIEHYTENGKIIFRTEYDDSFGKSLININNGDRKFEVNYIVNMPHTVPLSIENKYGNVFLERLSSASNIAIKYGKLKANDISSADKNKMMQIMLGYSDAAIEECSWLKIQMKYSKINIEESKALIVLSKYSKVYVDRGSSIVAEGKYDTYQIGTLANFVAESEYSHFKFKSIGKKLQLDTRYTDVKVGYMPASFESVNIINRYGSYYIGIEDGASYALKGIAKYGGISYPDNSRVNRFQKTTELTVEGFVGKDANTSNKVSIDTKYGSVKLK